MGTLRILLALSVLAGHTSGILGNRLVRVENHFFALAIYFMHYNYVRIHTTLRVTPAMAAGVAAKLWSMDDVVAMVEEREDRAQ